MPVRVAYKHGKTGDSGSFYKLRRFIGVCKFIHCVIICAAYMTEFTLNFYSCRRAYINYVFCKGGIFLKRAGGTVKHYSGSSESQSLYHLRLRRSVIEMKAYRNACFFSGGKYYRRQIISDFLIEKTRIHLHYNRSFKLLCRLCHTHYGFNIINIKGRYAEISLFCPVYYIF